MADIELVIKIPKRVYDYIRKYEHIANSDILDIKDAIINGTPLPKGHGRLVDENHVIAELVYRKHLLSDGVKCGEVTEIFDNAVVIDADKESNNETDN